MPDLSRQLINTAGVNQDKVNDYTTDTDWPTSQLAESGTLDSAVSTWVLRVPDGDIPDHRIGSPKYAASHNVVRVTVGSNVLFRGRNGGKDIERGDSVTFRNQRQSINLGDYNTDLGGIIVNNWSTPEQTDAARVQMLVSAYLSGSPRPSTNLNGSNFVITSSNTQTMPARVYTAMTPGDILREIAEYADKDVFVDRNGNLHYHGHDYAGFDSILRISDDPADLNTVTCFPIEPSGNQEAAEAINRLRLYWGPGNDDGNQRSVVADAPGHRSRTDYWEDVFFDDTSDNSTEAGHVAASMLAPLAQDVLTYTVTIGQPGVIQAGSLSQASPMTGDYIWMIKAGMRINFKSKAVRGGYRESGVNFGDAFELMHVRSVRWTMPTADAYYATLELEKPRSLGPRRRGKPEPTATTPKPAPEFEPNPSDTVAKFYNANDGGGDAENWSGNLSNQAGGANGTSFYNFHGNLPDEWQTSWAATAGAQYRVEGYVKSNSTARLKLGFGTAAAGSGSGAFDTSTLAEHFVSPVTSGTGSTWIFYSAGPFTAPTGTLSAALGKNSGGLDWDETTIYVVADTADNDEHAVDYGDCDHDSPFFLPSDYVECRLDELSGQIPVVLDDLADVNAASPADGDVLTWDDAASEWIAGAGGGGSGTGGAISGASVISSNTQSITTSTDTKITFATEVFDTDAYHSTTTNTSRITIPTGKAGKYVINGAGMWDTNTTGSRELRVMKNGANASGSPSNKIASSSISPLHFVSVILDLAVGDYIELNAWQDSGGTRTFGSTNAGEYSFLSAIMAPGDTTVGAMVHVMGFGMDMTDTGTLNQADRGDAFPVSITGTMYLRAFQMRMSVASTGTWEWGLFDYSSSATACTKLAGGTGSLNGTGWQTIAATSAPVTINAGNYMLIIKAPSSNQGTWFTGTGGNTGGGYKTIASYTWDDTPDLTTGWSDTSGPPVCRLKGDLLSGTQW